jgi:uncharacterized protein YkwD
MLVLIGATGVGGYYISRTVAGTSMMKEDRGEFAAASASTTSRRQDTRVAATPRVDTAPTPMAKLDTPRKQEAPKGPAAPVIEPGPKQTDRMPEPQAKPDRMVVPEPKPEPRPDPPPELKLAPEELQILQQVNTARAGDAMKLPPLRPDPVLFKIARDHAAKLASQDKLDDKLDEKKLGVLLTDGGYKFKAGKIGANQAADVDIQPGAVFQAWFDFNVSRSILLEPNEDTGIGIGKNGKGGLFYLMIYATPEK